MWLHLFKVIELHSSRHEGAFGKSCRNWYHALDSVTEKLYPTFVAILLTICGTPNTDMPLLLYTLPSSSFSFFYFKCIKLSFVCTRFLLENLNSREMNNIDLGALATGTNRLLCTQQTKVSSRFIWTIDPIHLIKCRVNGLFMQNRILNSYSFIVQSLKLITINI